MIARLVKTFDRIITGQETIGLHGKFLVPDLHHKWGTQVNNIGIAYVWKLCIGKAIRVLFHKCSNRVSQKKSIK
jgi:hypothetical protein